MTATHVDRFLIPLETAYHRLPSSVIAINVANLAESTSLRISFRG
jgi:hypothetical protein